MPREGHVAAGALSHVSLYHAHSQYVLFVVPTVLQVSVNLNPFQQGSAGAGGLRAKAMTETPFASGLRLFQMWFTKPYSPTSWSLDKVCNKVHACLC